MARILSFFAFFLIVTTASFFATLWFIGDQPALKTSEIINLTKNKQITLSSSWSGRKYPKAGIDGVIDGKFSFHTEKEKNPWWQIDLEVLAGIQSIQIYNRTNCCMEFAKTLMVSVSENGTDWSEVYRHDGTVFGGYKKLKPLTIDFKTPVEGRFVRLSLNENTFFHLDEVIIKGKIVAYFSD